MTMIIVKIFSGLGNQMFQYAFARALSKITGHEYKLDISAFDKDPAGRQYLLNRLSIGETIADRAEVFRLTKIDHELLRRLYAKICRLERPRSPFHIKERKDYVFDKDIMRFSGDAYFEGYWQNEKYFMDLESVLRQEFTLRGAFSAQAMSLMERIKETNSVSIHVRRGDYITSRNSNIFHGVLPLEYYRKAAEMVSLASENARFYVFSDDIQWVKSSFQIGMPFTAISLDSRCPVEELLLMSYCRQNIIANSSFSWWAAWLNKYQGKKVIAPKDWTVKSGIDSSDAVPKEWIRI
jgi:hypothetical protein